MLMTIVWGLLIYLISNGFGNLLLSKENKFYSLRSIIGFCFYLTILQVGFYPIAYFHLSSFVNNIWVGIVSLVGSIFALIKIKKLNLLFLKDYRFYLFLILFFVILKIIPSSDAGDDWFYVPLIKDNAFLNKINTINPRTGWPSDVVLIYAYQGYYLLNSALCAVQSLLFNSVDAPFITFIGGMTFLFAIYFSQILKFIKSLVGVNINKYLYLLIEMVACLFIGFWHLSHIYWGAFVIFTIFIPLYMIIFEEYLKTHSKRLMFMLIIINVALLSFVSSSLFIITFLTICFALYESFKKNLRIEDYFFIMTPVFAYLGFFIDKLIILSFIPILLLLIYFTRFKLNILANKYLKWTTFIIPIVLCLAGIILKLNFSWAQTKLGYSILIFNILTSGLFLYMLIKNKKETPLISIFMIFILLFFNPLVAPVIIKYLTTDQVFYRLFYITKNPLIIICIFIFIYENIKNKKFLAYSFVLTLGMLGVLYGKNIITETVKQKDYFNSYNYLLREGTDERNLGEFLNSLNKEANILSIYFAPRMWTLKHKTLVYRYPMDENLKENVVIKALYLEKDISNLNYENFKKEVKNNNWTHFIIFNKQSIKERLSSVTKTIYSNGTYTVLEVI